MSGREVEIINFYHSRLLEKERPASASILSNMPWHTRQVSELIRVGLPTALCHKAPTYPEAAPRIHPPSSATCPEHCPFFVKHTDTHTHQTDPIIHTTDRKALISTSRSVYPQTGGKQRKDSFRASRSRKLLSRFLPFPYNSCPQSKLLASAEITWGSGQINPWQN